MALEDTIIPQLLIKFFLFLFKQEIKDQQPCLQFVTCMQYTQYHPFQITKFLQQLMRVNANLEHDKNGR